MLTQLTFLQLDDCATCAYVRTWLPAWAAAHPDVEVREANARQLPLIHQNRFLFPMFLLIREERHRGACYYEGWWIAESADLDAFLADPAREHPRS